MGGERTSSGVRNVLGMRKFRVVHRDRENRRPETGSWPEPDPLGSSQDGCVRRAERNILRYRRHYLVC